MPIGFESAYKIGQQIGGRSGAQSQNLVQNLMTKKFSKDLELKSHAIKNGLGIQGDKEKGYVFHEGIYSSSKEMAMGLQSYQKQEAEAVRQNTSTALNVLGKAESLFKMYLDRVDKDPDNYEMNMMIAGKIDQLFNQEEIGGQANPFGTFGIKMDFTGSENDRQSSRDWQKEMMLSLDSAYQNDPTNKNVFSALKAMSFKYPKIAKELNINLKEDISTIQKRQETLAQKHQREVDENRRTAQMRADVEVGKQLKLASGKQNIEAKKHQKMIPRLQSMPPEKAYAAGFRMNDDGSLYIDPVTDAPVRLKSPSEVLGKRGNLKMVYELGRFRDDAMQAQSLLRDPEVKEILSQMETEGLWDRAKGKWSNAARKWLVDHGYAGNSKVTQAVSRMQMLASEKRKEFMGTAVTQIEVINALAWLPSAGDSYSTMLSKIDLTVSEADESFRQFLDMHKNDANMSQFYKAFGMKRFANPAVQRAVELERSGLSDDEIKQKLMEEGLLGAGR